MMSNSTFTDTTVHCSYGNEVASANVYCGKSAVSRKGGPALGWFSGTPGPIISESKNDVQSQIWGAL